MRGILSKGIVLYFVFGLIITSQALASISDSEQKLIPDDNTGNENFGRSISSFGDYFIAGAHGDDANGSSSGSAYIFKKNGDTWVQAAKLTAPDGSSNDQFGYSVAISDEYALVGARWDDASGSYSGSAYIFQRSGSDWGTSVKLLPSDVSADDEFGRAVSISGDYALIGAFGDDTYGQYAGAVYVFERISGNWTQVAKLTSNDIESGDRFGGSVSICGDYALVGAYGDNDNGLGSGSAYLFQRTAQGWSQIQKLTASDGTRYSYFGNSVSITDGRLVVGAYCSPDNGGPPTDLSCAGQAYLFELTANGWVEKQRLIVSDQIARQYLSKEFGVSISGNYIVLGAYGDKTKGNNAGAAYVFKQGASDWNEFEKITASDGTAGDAFGYSVSITGSDILVSSYLDDDNGSASGSVYAYKIEACPGDMDQNNTVDGHDLALFAPQFGQSCSCIADFDHDGFVDEQDLSIIAQGFGSTACQ